MIQKTRYYRNRRHLMNVAALPCQHCGQDGHTQAAHSNQLRHGKGRGIKASDEYTAALCQSCHYNLDQGSSMTKAQRIDFWDLAWRNTVRQLIEQDLWPIGLDVPAELTEQ